MVSQFFEVDLKETFKTKHVAMERNENIDESLFVDAKKDFKLHLDIVDNNRVIFSGKFGHGKTTFLQEFFKNDSKYEVFTLFPVNYSVASNEDIFRFIKYDLIIEMLTKKYNIEQANSESIAQLKTITKNVGEKLIRSIVRKFPDIGKDVLDTFDYLKTLRTEIYEIIDGQKYENSLIDFLVDNENAEGNIFESNLITKIIESAVLSSKKNGKKETILIIDDLDRIDPEHIFRILNVFAAHFDRKRDTDNNKFGFDKIILVCDIENIRSIFNAKYGSRTDFNGYIDKFYSYEIFSFSVRREIASFCDKMIAKADWKHSDGGAIQRSVLETLRFRYLDDNFLQDVLFVLFDNKQLDLRNIVKLKNMPIKFNSYINFINLPSIRLDDKPYIFSISLLSQLKGGAQSLKTSFKDIRGKNIPSDRLWNYVSELIYINTMHIHRNKVGFPVPFLLRNVQVEFQITRDNKYTFSSNNSQPIYLSDIDLFWLMSETIDLLIESNFI